LIITKSRYYFILFPFLLLLPGCIGTKHLKENERLLFSKKIKAPKGIDKDDLEDLYVKKANRRIPLTTISPLIGIHYLGKRFYKTEKYEKKIAKAEKKYAAKIEKSKSDRKTNNLQFRKQSKITKYNDRLQNGNQLMQWGEPTAVFDSVATVVTIERFENYLFSKGFLTNKVEAKVTSFKKLRLKRYISVKYIIEAGKPYIIDTIFYKIQDTTVFALVQKNQKFSFIGKGKQYDQGKFTQERERIDLLMKDNGYYDFSRQYVEFNVDTAYKHNRRVAVQLVVNQPANRDFHKQFYVEEINIPPDAGVLSPGKERTEEIYKNIKFHFFERHYSPKILSQRVFISKGAEYSRTKTFNTQRQLANLNMFKFVNINYDTTGGRFVANIFASPLDRYQWSNELGLSVTQGFPGPFYNLNFMKRNIFRGFENFEMNGRIGYEGVAAATSAGSIYQSTEAGVNASITFPQFLFPLGEERRYQLGRVNPRTKVGVGYNYTDRPEYQRAATSINLTYSWENQRVRRFDFTLASVNLINSTTESDFQSFLETQFNDLGNTLIYSFRPSFVSSMILSMIWNHNNYGSPDKSSAFIRWSVESGGTLQNLVDYTFIETRGLQSFKYLRASADLRRINILNKNTTLAYRFNGGVAYSYDSRGVLPYEKYFFIGGSNSIRAWRPRRLGQGSFKPLISDDISQNGYFDYKFEKPGDMILEASIELRKKLFGFVEGAVFLDAGNVWTFNSLKKETGGVIVENGNSKFEAKEFYKEIGVGTGFGFRFNFSFLILRFDVGMKVYDPARDEGSRFVLDNAKPFRPFGVEKEPMIYNIGIGYPF
jgi:hypothetical protein